MKTALAIILMLASPLAFAYRMPEFDVRAILWNLFVLAAVAVCFGLADYAISKAPFIMDPVKAFIHWVLVVILCVILIFLILGFVGL